MTAQTDPLTSGDHTFTVTVGERERTYHLHVPAGETPAAGWPVVLVFHGGGSNGEVMQEFTDLNDTADSKKFLAVYPEGSGRAEGIHTWNGGMCCGYAMRREIDDVGFVELLLDDLAERVPVDECRIYATGMSNGAVMAYRVADELADRIAAIAPVAGPMGSQTCAPSRPVPVMHFHGTDDEFAQYEGGVGARSLSRTNFLSVEHTIAQWVAANGCDAEPDVTDLPILTEDGTRITRTTYSGGDARSEVILFTIHGGGHTWPGHPGRLAFLGTTTGNLDANDAMWRFFQRHPLPAAE